MREVLVYFALKYNGDFGDILGALQRKEKVDQQLKKELFKQLRCKFVTILDDDYPKNLKEVSAPPFVLFYYGNLDILQMKTVAYIGTEQYSEESAHSTIKFVKELVKKEFCLISGFNVGINRLVHKEAINNNGYSVAVLSNGIDKCSQRINQDIYEEMKNHQLIISEYPFEVEANKKRSVFKNRLIGGLCNALIVGECDLGAPYYKAIDYAVEHDKNVYSIPVSALAKKQGTNELIKNGAMLMNDIELVEVS